MSPTAKSDGEGPSLPNRLDVVGPFRSKRTFAMTQDADDPTKWHLADIVTIGKREAGWMIIDDKIVHILEGPNAPINTLFHVPTIPDPDDLDEPVNSL